MQDREARKGLRRDPRRHHRGAHRPPVQRGPGLLSDQGGLPEDQTHSRRGRGQRRDPRPLRRVLREQPRPRPLRIRPRMAPRRAQGGQRRQPSRGLEGPHLRPRKRDVPAVQCGTPSQVQSVLERDRHEGPRTAEGLRPGEGRDLRGQPHASPRTRAQEDPRGPQRPAQGPQQQDHHRREVHPPYHRLPRTLRDLGQAVQEGGAGRRGGPRGHQQGRRIRGQGQGHDPYRYQDGPSRKGQGEGRGAPGAGPHGTGGRQPPRHQGHRQRRQGAGRRQQHHGRQQQEAAPCRHGLPQMPGVRRGHLPRMVQDLRHPHRVHTQIQEQGRGQHHPRGHRGGVQGRAGRHQGHLRPQQGHPHRQGRGPRLCARTEPQGDPEVLRRAHLPHQDPRDPGEGYPQAQEQGIHLQGRYHPLRYDRHPPHPLQTQGDRSQHRGRPQTRIHP